MVNRPKESSRADETSPIDPDKPKDMWQLRVNGGSNHKEAGAASHHIGLSSLKQRSRVKGIVCHKGGVDQEVRHLPKLPADHKSGVKGVHEKTLKDDLVPRQIPRAFEGMPYLRYPTNSQSTKYTCRCVGKFGIKAGYPVQTFNLGQAP